MKRPHILRHAIKKAARQAFDAERALAWTPNDPACRRSHARAVARVERAIYQAQDQKQDGQKTIEAQAPREHLGPAIARAPRIKPVMPVKALGMSR